MNLFRRLAYTGSCFFELARGVLLVAVALTLVHLFVATVFVVEGISMEPNFHTSELVVVNRASYLFGSPKRGDVTVLRFPGDPEHRKYIKRLIGLPGDTIEISNGTIFVNGTKLSEPYLPEGRLTSEMITGRNHWTLGPDDYFLVGDNRDNSNDSRTWGPSAKRFLIGKAILVVWPFTDTNLVPKESYGL